MRSGIIVHVTARDFERLRPIIDDRNGTQKHTWRAKIVLLTGHGHVRPRSCAMRA